MHPLEAILRMCAEATPNPWYPSVYAQATGTAREQLDPDLDQLRMGGLIRLTEWVQGIGQGYALTPGGKEVLENPRRLNRLRAGELSLRASQGPPPPDLRGNRGTAWDRGEAVRDALLGSYTWVVTYSLIALNVLVFLAGDWLASVRQANRDDYLAGTDKTGEVARIQESMGALRSATSSLTGCVQEKPPERGGVAATLPGAAWSSDPWFAADDKRRCGRIASAMVHSPQEKKIVWEHH
jgi:hypothetical protein